MNTQLIPVVSAAIGNQTVQTVDGRALHTFLEVKTRFNDWIVSRIEEYGFIDGQDFSSFLAKTSDGGFTQNSVKPQGGRPTKEYALSLDMGKELAMVERTAKGKQARQYFIECERRALEAAQPQPQNAHLAAQLAELLKGKVLVDYQDLRTFAGGALAARNVLDQVEKLAVRLEAQCGQPLVEGLLKEQLTPASPAPARRSFTRAVMPVSPWEAPIAEFLAGRDEVTQTEIFQQCLKEPQTQSAMNRVAHILRRLGYACETRRQGSRIIRLYVRVSG